MLLTCSFCFSSWPGEVDRLGNHICGTVTKGDERVNLHERTPDGHLRCWLLYDPEPWPPDSVPEREINLWVRRANVFTSQQAAIDALDALKGEHIAWRKYDPIFPELWIGIDSRGYRWLMEPAPVDAPGGKL